MRTLLSRVSCRNSSTAAVHLVYYVEELVDHGYLLVDEILLLSGPAARLRWCRDHRTTVPGVHNVQNIHVVRLRRWTRRRSSHPEPLGSHPEPELGVVRCAPQLAPDRAHYLLVLGPSDDLGSAARPVVLLSDPLGVPPSVLLFILILLLVRHLQDRWLNSSWIRNKKFSLKKHKTNE